MRILVTGTAGFIGFHLATALLAEGHDVTGFDNFNDYYSVRLKRDRHAQLEGNPRYRGVESDLSDYEPLRALVAEGRFDRVCHLAAQAGVRYSLKNPFAYERSNLAGFINILEACRHAGISRLVYASSSSVYGGNTKLPFAESDRVDTPISLYAATKKANELMAHVYSHLFGLQTVGLRFFTVYGPWGRPDMAMWLFAEAMLAGKSIRVFNHGDMERDFTYVNDIVGGIKGALFSEGLAPCEVFNLGNNHPEQLMEMIRVLAQCLGVEPAMEMCPMEPGDVRATYADVDKARLQLGYNPATPMREGVPKFIAWYRRYHGL